MIRGKLRSIMRIFAKIKISVPVRISWILGLLLVLMCWLERPFSEDGIFSTLNSMKEDKAPGLDGFYISFFQRGWEIIKDNLMNVFDEFFQSKDFNGHLNNTFIMLILKKHNASVSEDFRPISLINVYKILSKTLTIRLKHVINRIISLIHKKRRIFFQPQTAFIASHQILDGVLIANEIIDERHKMGRNRIMCKLDLEKAYDHASWDFLDYILKGLFFWGK